MAHEGGRRIVRTGPLAILSPLVALPGDSLSLRTPPSRTAPTAEPKSSRSQSGSEAKRRAICIDLYDPGRASDFSGVDPARWHGTN